MRDDRSGICSSAIPLIDWTVINPLDPIAPGNAAARSEGQGRRWILREANRCSGAARPENLGRRRSLALDRSEHDGRLAASGEKSSRDVRTTVTALAVALALIVMPLGIAFAEPLSGERLSDHPAASDPRDPYAGFVVEAARRFAIPERWIRAVMRVESSGDPGATSPKGAMGLMQIMPATWAELRARYHLGDDVFDPRDNILAGAAYLAELHRLYGSPGFLAAYNAGPRRYEQHLVTSDPLPHETVAYMAKLLPMIDTDAAPVMQVAARSLHNDWADAPLFFAQKSGVDHAESPHGMSSPKIARAATPIVDLSGLAPVSSALFVQRAPDKGRQQ